MSDDIETSFLVGKEKHIFQTPEFKYVINFKEMIQENIDPRYRTKRNIKRRPDDKPTQTYVLLTYISYFCNLLLRL